MVGYSAFTPGWWAVEVIKIQGRRGQAGVTVAVRELMACSMHCSSRPTHRATKSPATAPNR